MAEKGFGVKEINLIGASGTPTIESPNNLNLNAVNVAISTNATIGGNLTVTGTVGIAGTLTYEDVTNVDAIGIITARQGVRVNVDSGNPAPASATNYFSVGASQDLKIYHNGGTNYIAAADGDIKIRSDTFQLVSDDTAGRAIYLDNSNSRLELGFDGTAAAYFSSSNVQFAKPITASTDSQHDIGTNSVRFRNAYVDTYYGSGANLTGIAVTEAPVTDYTISANGSSAYRIHGGGVDETANSPDLYLIRGQKYRFNNTTGSGHPFAIRVSNGGSAYTDGVTGSQNGIQFFTVPYAAPASLVYQCTIHSGMVGSIVIRGGANFASISNNADNRVITGGSDGNLNGEANLTFDGSILDVTGKLRIDISNGGTAGSGTAEGIFLRNLQETDNNCISIFGGADSYSAAASAINFINVDHSANYGDISFDTRGSGGYGERFRIDSNGSVNKPKNPAFYAYLTTNNAVYTSGSTVPWANTSIDTRNAFQTSGTDIGRFIVPTTGIYYFGWRLNRRDDSRFDIGIYKNGSIQYVDELRTDYDSNNWQAESSHYLMSCTAGQKIDLRIYSVTNAGTAQFDGGGNGYYDAFFGWMVG